MCIEWHFLMYSCVWQLLLNEHDDDDDDDDDDDVDNLSHINTDFKSPSAQTIQSSPSIRRCTEHWIYWNILAAKFWIVWIDQEVRSIWIIDRYVLRANSPVCELSVDHSIILNQRTNYLVYELEIGWSENYLTITDLLSHMLSHGNCINIPTMGYPLRSEPVSITL